LEYTAFSSPVHKFMQTYETKPNGLNGTGNSVSPAANDAVVKSNDAAAAQSQDGSRDFEHPQREAAFFYGLFLRGHDAGKLRRDIAIPMEVLIKWHKEVEREPLLRDVLTRVVEYRRHVLAIFDTLIGAEAGLQRVQ
jgi:hypothetical protein